MGVPGTNAAERGKVKKRRRKVQKQPEVGLTVDHDSVHAHGHVRIAERNKLDKGVELLVVARHAVDGRRQAFRAAGYFEDSLRGVGRGMRDRWVYEDKNQA